MRIGNGNEADARIMIGSLIFLVTRKQVWPISLNSVNKCANIYSLKEQGHDATKIEA